MSLDAAIDRVLARCSADQVQTIAARCAKSGNVGSLPGASPGAQDAVAKLATAWASADGVTGAGVALALRSALRSRRAHAATTSRPVWTGPGAKGDQRLTSA